MYESISNHVCQIKVSQNGPKCISEELKFKIFQGGMLPDLLVQATFGN